MMESNKNVKLATHDNLQTIGKGMKVFPMGSPSPAIREGNTAIKNDDSFRNPNNVVQEIHANLELLEDLQARMGFMLCEVGKVLKRA